jgi:hypothetical protein
MTPTVETIWESFASPLWSFIRAPVRDHKVSTETDSDETRNKSKTKKEKQTCKIKNPKPHGNANGSIAAEQSLRDAQKAFDLARFSS